MTEYGDPDRLEPHYLLNTYLPADAPIETRVSVAVACRNPWMTHTDVGELADVSPTTVNNATSAFARGTLEERGKSETGSHGIPYGDRTSIGDWTRKQQAVIEFIARYPSVMSHDSWTKKDVALYVANRTGVDVTGTYVYKIWNRHREFVFDHRKRLRKQGDLEGLDDVPEAPDKIPKRIHSRVCKQVSDDALPDGNLDQGTEFGADAWLKPYTEVDLADVDETTLPHTESEDDGTVDLDIDLSDEDESNRIVTERPNATYSGPASGVDTTSGNGTQAIADAPYWVGDDTENPGEEPDSGDANPRVSTPETWDNDPSAVQCVTVALPQDHYDELRELGHDNPADAFVARADPECSDVLADLEDTFIEWKIAADNEHRLHSGPASAARLATVRRCLKEVRTKLEELGADDD